LLWEEDGLIRLSGFMALPFFAGREVVVEKGDWDALQLGRMRFTQRATVEELWIGRMGIWKTLARADLTDEACMVVMAVNLEYVKYLQLNGRTRKHGGLA